MGNRLRSLARLATAAAVAAAVCAGFEVFTAAQAALPLQTVFVIVMENQDWSQIKANAAAPYVNHSLLPIAAHAERYTTPPGLHPSAPNYWWMEAGQDFGLRGRSNYTPAAFPLKTGSHLVNELEQAGITWKTYQEDIDGTSCPLADRNRYAVRHNPFVFFTDVTGNGSPDAARCIAHVRPYYELATDLAQGTVARYNYIVPNTCNDMHDCGIAAGDTWLANNIPVILNSRAYLNGGVVFVVWDEGADAQSDGPIGLIVLSHAAKQNYSNTVPYTHSSLLKTIQEIFGVGPLLGDAANATDLADLFARTTTPAPAIGGAASHRTPPPGATVVGKAIPR